MVPFERALVNSCRPSIVIFPLSLHAFVLQHATFPHPTSSLPKISHVLLGVGGWPMGYNKRMCWAVVRAISFQDCQPM